jgi:predicted metalloenzyme YecM
VRRTTEYTQLDARVTTYDELEARLKASNAQRTALKNSLDAIAVAFKAAEVEHAAVKVKIKTAKDQALASMSEMVE